MKFQTNMSYKTGFYGIMVIENLRSAVASKEKFI